jgi:hypothetical protein
MHPINSIFIAVTIGVISTIAQAQEKCLDHLGGGISDIDCYTQSISSVQKKSNALYAKIMASIPETSGYRNLLNQYRKTKNNEVLACDLLVGSTFKWSSKPVRVPPMFNADQVAKADCSYSIRAVELKLLEDVIDAFGANAE